MSLLRYVDSAWQERDTPKRFVDSAWQDTDGYVCENGVWVEKWSAFPSNYMIYNGKVNPSASRTRTIYPSSATYSFWETINNQYRALLKSGGAMESCIVDWTFPFTVPKGSTIYVDYSYEKNTNVTGCQFYATFGGYSSSMHTQTVSRRTMSFTTKADGSVLTLNAGVGNGSGYHYSNVYVNNIWYE